MIKNQIQIIRELNKILDKNDIEDRFILNRKKTRKDNNSEIMMKLNHIAIIIQYLKLDSEALRREIFEYKRIIENM